MKRTKEGRKVCSLLYLAGLWLCSLTHSLSVSLSFSLGCLVRLAINHQALQQGQLPDLTRAAFSFSPFKLQREDPVLSDHRNFGQSCDRPDGDAAVGGGDAAANSDSDSPDTIPRSLAHDADCADGSSNKQHANVAAESSAADVSNSAAALTVRMLNPVPDEASSSLSLCC